jgi:hypothetical protein
VERVLLGQSVLERHACTAVEEFWMVRVARPLPPNPHSKETMKSEVRSAAASGARPVKQWSNVMINTPIAEWRHIRVSVKESRLPISYPRFPHRWHSVPAKLAHPERWPCPQVPPNRPERIVAQALRSCRYNRTRYPTEIARRRMLQPGLR